MPLPITLAEIEELAREAVKRNHPDLLSPLPNELLVRSWLRAFLARWSIQRHLRDLDSMTQDLRVLASRGDALAEQEFRSWLNAERVRHEKAIVGDGEQLARQEREVGADLVRDAVGAAQRLASRWILVVVDTAPEKERETR